MLHSTVLPLPSEKNFFPLELPCAVFLCFFFFQALFVLAFSLPVFFQCIWPGIK